MSEGETSAKVLLERYALYDAIASGGMATVHLARQSGSAGFGRTVAVKRLHPQLAGDPEFVAMFVDEARLAARVRHPNVIPTLDVVRTDKELFVVLEYVHGESLAGLHRAIARRGERIPVDIAVAILVNTLAGLHAAHEATSESGEPLRIVHRDVSPQNIMVGADGTARVLDFGIAKAASRLQTTRDGSLKGKIAYMGPEQVEGRADRRSDLFSAAVVLWELLAGRRMHAATNEMQLLSSVLAGPLAAPSEVSGGEPSPAEPVVMRALHLDPDRRYQTAREFARALEAAVRPATQSEVAEWVSRTVPEHLAARAARIVAIESGDVVPAPSGKDLPRGAGTEPTVVLPADPGGTRFTSVTGAKGLPRPISRGSLFAAVGAVVLVFAGAARWGARAPAERVVSPAAAGPSAVRTLGTSTPNVEASATPAPAVSAPALPAASASSVAVSAPPRASTRPAVVRPAAAPPACDPPYVIKPDGSKRYKAECL